MNDDNMLIMWTLSLWFGSRSVKRQFSWSGGYAIALPRRSSTRYEHKSTIGRRMFSFSTRYISPWDYTGVRR